MKITELSQLELLQGSFTLIYVLISLIIGILFCGKYFSTKRIEHITLGFSWIFLSSAWWGTTMQFLSIVLFSKTISLFLWMFLANVGIPIAILFWIYSISHIMYKENEKQILLLFMAICVPYEIILLALLFTDPNLVGTQVATFNTISKPYIIVFQLFAIFTAFLTGVVFSIKSMKVDDKEIKWKGRILLIAFISFLIGTIGDALLALSEVPLVIVRLILISSSIEYYLAWFLPDRLKEWLIGPE